MIRGLLHENRMLFRDTQTGTVELYDMSVDPSQENDLAPGDPATVGVMSELLDGVYEHISMSVH